MALPKTSTLYNPILKVLSDEQKHELEEVRRRVAELLELSTEDLSTRISSGMQTGYASRIGWARRYLIAADIIEAPQRGYLKITEKGKELYEKNISITDSVLAQISPEFVEFTKKKPKIQSICSILDSETDTPQETMEQMHQLLNDQLAEELLSEIFKQTPYFFEKLVLDLMEAMGYGSGSTTPDNHDGGIDGIIHEDKLGFNLIYVQAKRWTNDHTINTTVCRRNGWPT